MFSLVAEVVALIQAHPSEKFIHNAVVNFIGRTMLLIAYSVQNVEENITT